MPKILIGFLSIFIISILFRIVFFYLYPLNLREGQDINFKTTLLEDPKINFGRQTFKVKTGSFWQKETIFISTKDVPHYYYGQDLIISGRLEKKIFNKQTFLVLSSSKIFSKEDGALPLFGRIRERVKNFCLEALPQPYAGLLAGMLLGFKRSLPLPSALALQKTGLSHILVIDGMKITLIAGFLINFFMTFFKRRIALVLSVLAILIYIILSGLEISALRAGIMAVSGFAAQALGKKYTGLYVLFLTGGILLFWDPLLLENAGFQLSVGATAGIIALRPLIPLKGIFFDDLAIALAAQVSTFPIILVTFGKISLLSIFIHALVMWTVPPIMILGGISVISSFILFNLGKIFIFFSLPFLWYFQTIADFFAKFNQELQVSQVPILFSLGWYMLFISIILFLKKTIYQGAGKKYL